MKKIFLKKGDTFNVIFYKGKNFIHTSTATALASEGPLTRDYNEGQTDSPDELVIFEDAQGNTTGGAVDGIVAEVEQVITLGLEMIRDSSGRIYEAVNL